VMMSFSFLTCPYFVDRLSLMSFKLIVVATARVFPLFSALVLTHVFFIFLSFQKQKLA
jgi:hypothetical protein